MVVGLRGVEATSIRPTSAYQAKRYFTPPVEPDVGHVARTVVYTPPRTDVGHVRTEGARMLGTDAAVYQHGTRPSLLYALEERQLFIFLVSKRSRTTQNACYGPPTARVLRRRA